MQKLIDRINTIGLSRMLWTTDLDLTLVEPSADPNQAGAEAGLEEACRRLDAQTAGFFIITGRDIAYVDQKVFPQTRFRISAEYHNMLRLDPKAEPAYLSPVPQWHLIDADMDALVAKYDGLVMRKKTFMRSLHYTHLKAPDRNAVKAELRAALDRLLEKHTQLTGQKLLNTDGGFIFDMGPDTGDKGKALNDIYRHVQAANARPLVPIYFGDSPGDLPAARAAQDLGGIFVAVGPDPRVTAGADYCLENPAACRALFKKVSGLNPAPAQMPRPTP